MCARPIPISPKQALDELDVEKSLPPASPPKDEEENANSPSTEENSLRLDENEDEEELSRENVQSEIE